MSVLCTQPARDLAADALPAAPGPGPRLESGTGQLALIDPAHGRPQVVTELPGFARGLAFAGPYAFIGLSKIRATSVMDGVPLAERRDKLKCGVTVVDLRSGGTVASLEFQTAVEEIFDVQVLASLRFPEVVGFQKENIQHTFVVPHVARGGESADLFHPAATGSRLCP